MVKWKKYPENKPEVDAQNYIILKKDGEIVTNAFWSPIGSKEKDSIWQDANYFLDIEDLRTLQMENEKVETIVAKMFELLTISYKIEEGIQVVIPPSQDQIRNVIGEISKDPEYKHLLEEVLERNIENAEIKQSIAKEIEHNTDKDLEKRD